MKPTPSIPRQHVIVGNSGNQSPYCVITESTNGIQAWVGARYFVQQMGTRFVEHGDYFCDLGEYTDILTIYQVVAIDREAALELEIRYIFSVDLMNPSEQSLVATEYDGISEEILLKGVERGTIVPMVRVC